MATSGSARAKKLKIDPTALRLSVSKSLSEEKDLRCKISEIANFNIGPNVSDSHSIEVYLVSRLGFSRVLEAAGTLSSCRSLPAAIINENISSVLGLPADDVAPLIPLLQQISTKIQPREILAPPTSLCLTCQQQLTKNHDSITVRVYTVKGLVEGRKWNLRCNSCKSSYGYSMYGSRNESHMRLYPDRRDLVEASDCCFLERELFKVVALANFG